MPKFSSAISSGFEQKIKDITAKENASIDECKVQVALLTKIYKEIEDTKTVSYTDGLTVEQKRTLFGQINFAKRQIYHKFLIKNNMTLFNFGITDKIENYQKITDFIESLFKGKSVATIGILGDYTNYGKFINVKEPPIPPIGSAGNNTTTNNVDLTFDTGLELSILHYRIDNKWVLERRNDDNVYTTNAVDGGKKTSRQRKTKRSSKKSKKSRRNRKR